MQWSSDDNGMYAAKALALVRTSSRSPLGPLGSPLLGWGQLRARPHIALLHIGILLVVFKLYHHLNFHTADQGSRAYAHAAALVGMERQFGLFLEPHAQQLALHPVSLPLLGGVLQRATLWDAMVYIYAHGHITWLATMLLWLYLFRREKFPRVRDLAHVATVVAVLLRVAYPLAPPRLFLAGAPYSMVDGTGVPVSERMYASLAGFNVYGAMPSVHVLWALLTGLGLSMGVRHPLGRLLCLAFPLTITLSVIITANHYVFDCLGAALLLGCCALVLAGWYRLWHRHRSQVLRFPAQDQRGVTSGLQPLDAPFVLCSFASIILLAGGDTSQHLIGLMVLGGTLAIIVVARQRVRMGLILRQSATAAEWWCGLLLVAGVTVIDADTSGPRLVGAFMWSVACALPMVARVWPVLLPISSTRTGRQNCTAHDLPRDLNRKPTAPFVG